MPSARCENERAQRPATPIAPARPVFRPIEYAGAGQLIDANTRELVSPRVVAEEYNALLDIVQRVAILGGEADVVLAAQRLLKDGVKV